MYYSLNKKTGASYSETVIEFNLTNPSMITNWHLTYTEGGTEALDKSPRWQSKMAKQTSRKKKAPTENTLDSSEIERLRQEVNYLKIENAYFKKLKELGLEDHRKSNKLNSH